MQKKQIITLSLLALGILIFVAIDASLLTERQIYSKILSRKPTLASTIDISNAAMQPSADQPIGGTGDFGFGNQPSSDDIPTGEPADSAMPIGSVDPFAIATSSGYDPSAGYPAGGSPGAGYPAPGGGSNSSGSSTGGGGLVGNNASNGGYSGTDPFQGSPDLPPLPTLPPDTESPVWPTDVVIPTLPPALPTATAAALPTATPAVLPTAVPTQPPAAPTATQPPVVQPTATAVAQATVTPAQPTSAPLTPTAPPPAPLPGGGALVSLPASSAPNLDGAANDPAWAAAPALTVSTSGGANHSATQVTVKSVYDGQRVYFLLTWADPTSSLLRQPWEKQPDGSWKRLVGAQNAGGDETQFYEDKLAFLWPIQNSLPDFNTQGCGGLCHEGESGKAYGNMYTAGAGQRADLWQMKAVRGVGQVDDQYLDEQQYSKQTPSAGFHPDPFTTGGYRENQNKEKDAPAFMIPGGGDRSGAGAIAETAKTEFDPSLFNPGERVSSVLSSPFQGDRGDITGSWHYADGVWTLELSRALVTGSPYDVQFDDLSREYAFALATFDNAQVRHAVQSGASVLRFQR